MRAEGQIYKYGEDYGRIFGAFNCERDQNVTQK
jgi:hypothetical protein